MYTSKYFIEVHPGWPMCSINRTNLIRPPALLTSHAAVHACLLFYMAHPQSHGTLEIKQTLLHCVLNNH